jgi:hypothetical protein
MEEDTDEKVRRNLVVASATILLSAWLEIPFGAVFSKFLDLQGAAPAPYKFWVAELTLMAYFGVRYSFTAEGQKYTTMLRQELLALYTKNAMGLAQRRANSYAKSGKESPVFCGFLGKHLRRRTGLTTPVNANVKITFRMEGQTDPFNFAVVADYEWRNGDGARASDAGNATPIPVAINGLSRVLVHVKSYVRCWSYSRGSIGYLVPAFLALSAVAALLCKIIFGYAALS